jgi:hypothetical protein
LRRFAAELIFLAEHAEGAWRISAFAAKYFPGASTKDRRADLPLQLWSAVRNPAYFAES